MNTSRIVRPMGFDPRPLGACSGLARGSLEQAARQRVETRKTAALVVLRAVMSEDAVFVNNPG